LAPTFTAHPPDPFYVLEGSNITSVWQYNLDGSLDDVVLQFIGSSTTLTVVDKYDINRDAAVPETVYQGRVQEHINATHAEITIFDFQRSESGEYQIELFNSNRQRASDRVTVQVQYPPEFTSVSNDVVLVEGEGDPSVTLECTEDGEPTPIVTWTRVYDNGGDGGVLTTGNQFVLEKNRTNSGTYHRTAYNGIGTAPNRTIKVEVNYIVKPLVNDSTICEGDVISITCPADSRPAVHTYQLFENGIPVADGNSSAGVWIVSRDLKEGNFSYRCVANNTISTSEETVNITAKVPSKDYPLENITVVEGENRTLTCNTSESMLTVTWTEVSTSSQSNGIMRDLTNISRNDAGEYKCEARNDCGTSSASTFLTMLYKPENFKFTVSKSTVCQGTVVTFNCSADGNPAVDTYQLFENDSPVSDGSNSLGMWSRNMSSGGVSIYKCMANNSAGTVYSMILTVTVNVPSSIQVIQDQNVTEGNNLTRTCNASGIPSPRVSWIKPDGQSENGSVLKLVNIRRNQTGAYRCEASNVCGNATEMATIDVQFKPEKVLLTTSAVNKKACLGDIINFTCSADANPTVTYQLFKNETAILKANAAGMWSKTLENEGVFFYKCVSKNSLGSENSMNVAVTVDVPPSIIQITQHQSVTEGDNVTLMCNVSGVLPPKVSWITPNGERVSRNPLKVENVSRTQAGEYKCEVSNKCGNATNVTRIDVQLPSSIIQITQHQNVTEGDNVTLMCNVSGVPPPTVYWMKPNGERVSGYKLEVKNISRSEAGKYKCEASNEFGNATKMTSVGVQYPPENVQFTSSAMDNKACTGDMISFNCSADANPSVTSYQLFENGTAVLDVNRLGMWKRNVSTSGVFMYKCVANNSLGSGVSLHVMLKVNVPSTIETIQDQNLAEGETTNLTCAASGMPQPNVFWIKPNNQSVPGNVLKLVNISRNEAGQYKCDASNECGNATAMASINVHYTPQNVQFTTSAMDNKACTGDMISFNCSADANPAVTSYQLFENDTAILDVTRFGVWKRHVSTGEVFMYKCVANNSLGSGVSSYVMVTVNVPSTIETIQDQNVSEGETVDLTCAASGMPQPNMSWIKPNNQSVAGNVLKLENISRNEAGQYKCEASNECGNATAMASIDVHYKPDSFKFTVSKSTVCQGTVVTFNCSADGNPAVETYQLLENDSPVSDGSNHLGMWSRNMSSGGVSIYKCMANNSVGTAYSMTLTVTVNVPSSIQVIQDQNVTEGNNLTLTCNASGIPSPMVSW
ncbi:hemicentin-2-like, partial [Stylophora pistillata]|uniref:hemicentin-2-like n=1 Tax=Stylophora pistillata TaxID=50429 RepID=UPI000C04231C